MSGICIFGDSISKGVVFDAAKKKYSVLKSSFANMLGKEGVSVVNRARFGCTVTDGLAIMSRCGELPGACDLTLLEFGGNDCDYDWEKVSGDPFGSHDCKTPVTLFPRMYRTLIEAVVSSGGRPLLLTLPPVDEHRYFARISQGLNVGNILSFLGNVRTIFTWQEKYSEMVKALSKLCNVPLVDVREVFMSLLDYRDALCEDGIHPNEKGHRLIFDILKPKILPLNGNYSNPT